MSFLSLPCYYFYSIILMLLHFINVNSIIIRICFLYHIEKGEIYPYGFSCGFFCELKFVALVNTDVMNELMFVDAVDLFRLSTVI